VFDDGGDEIRVRVIGGVEHAEDRVVVGLRATAGENNFLGMRVYKSGYVFASGFDGGAGFLSGGMDGCGVAKFAGEEGEHGFEHDRVDRRGGVVVEINARGHDSLRITGVRRGKNCGR